MHKERPGQDVNMIDNPATILMERHFEYGFSRCVKSVHSVNLSRYEVFKENI